MGWPAVSVVHRWHEWQAIAGAVRERSAYYGGGIVTGAIGGALPPLHRTFAGAALVGTVAAFPVWVGFWFVSEGAPWRWDRGDWYRIALFSVVFGIAGGRLMRKDV